MTIIRRSTLRQSDVKDQLNHSNHHFKRRRGQRREPAAKRTLTRGEHHKILQAKVEEAPEETPPYRAEGGEEQTNKTTNLDRGAGTKYPKAKRRRQV